MSEKNSCRVRQTVTTSPSDSVRGISFPPCNYLTYRSSAISSKSFWENQADRENEMDGIFSYLYTRNPICNVYAQLHKSSQSRRFRRD